MGRLRRYKVINQCINSTISPIYRLLDLRSITEKAEYIKSNDLGGAMVWSIETDDFRGISGEKYPLINTLNRILR